MELLKQPIKHVNLKWDCAQDKALFITSKSFVQYHDQSICPVENYMVVFEEKSTIYHIEKEIDNLISKGFLQNCKKLFLIVTLHGRSKTLSFEPQEEDFVLENQISFNSFAEIVFNKLNVVPICLFANVCSGIFFQSLIFKLLPGSVVVTLSNQLNLFGMRTDCFPLLCRLNLKGYLCLIITCLNIQLFSPLLFFITSKDENNNIFFDIYDEHICNTQTFKSHYLTYFFFEENLKSLIVPFSHEQIDMAKKVYIDYLKIMDCPLEKPLKRFDIYISTQIDVHSKFIEGYTAQVNLYNKNKEIDYECVKKLFSLLFPEQIWWLSRFFEYSAIESYGSITRNETFKNSLKDLRILFENRHKHYIMFLLKFVTEL